MDYIKNVLKNEKNQNILYILLLSILFILFAVYIGHIYGNLYMDCGREAILPELILKGKILYKDIFGMYNPFSYQINALLYSIFGASLNTLYGAAYINALLFLVGIYFICKKFINGYYSFCIAFLLMCLYIFGCTGIVSYLYPYAFAFPYAVSFFTYSVYCFLNYIENGQKKNLYISALLMGLAFANKPEFLLCVIPALFILHSKKESLKNYIIYILLCLLPVIISYVFLFIQGFSLNDLTNYINFNINFFNSHEQNIYTSSFVFSPISEFSLKIIFENLILFLTTVLGIACYIAIAKKNTFLKLFVIFYSPLVLYFLYNTLYQNFYVNYFSWITIALLAVIYFYTSDKTKNTEGTMFLFLAASALLSMIRINFLPIFKGSCAIYMLLPIITVWIFFIKTDIKYFQKIKYKLYISLSLIIIGAVNIAVVKNVEIPSMELKTAKGTIVQRQSDIQMFHNIENWIKDNTTKDDSVLVLPEGTMMNFLTDRPTKPLYYHLIPNHIAAIGEANIVKGLNADKPDYIVLTNLKYDMYGKGQLCIDYGQKICDFIKSNYTQKQEFNVPQSSGEPFIAFIYKKIKK